MKKYIACILVLMLILTSTGCNGDRLNGQSAVSTSEENSNAYFVGKVIEIYGDGYLLAVTNSGNQHFEVGDWVAVDVNMEDYSDYSLGDHLKVEFDDAAPLSNPPLIKSDDVFTIHKTDKNGNRLE